jgi:protein-tyrosine-phosphatase
MCVAWHDVPVRALFVCVANSGRSVMAERLFRQVAGGRHEARSAGSAPGDAPHPVVLEALAELGIDASDHIPAKLDDERIAWADVVVATCDDACPVVPGKRYVSWQLPDPKSRPLAEVRVIRDDIAERVRALLRSEDDEHDRGDAEDRSRGEKPGRPAGVEARELAAVDRGLDRADAHVGEDHEADA